MDNGQPIDNTKQFLPVQCVWFRYFITTSSTLLLVVVYMVVLALELNN